MKNKPNLVLTGKDLLDGAKKPNRNFSAKLKTDLITVLEYMIENKNSMKIDLKHYQHTFTSGNDCGTYRCVCGWWAYWLDIPILTKTGRYTNRFLETFNDDLFWGFARTKKLQSNSSFKAAFFASSGSLENRLKLAKALEVA